MTQGRRPGSDLPAEYVDPWRLLRRDLRAVLASVSLRLQEFWRRNREADLWRPGFWPEALAPWFWPLLLLLLFSLPVLATIGLGHLSSAASPPRAPSAAPPAQSVESPSPAGFDDLSPPQTVPPLTAAPESVSPETLTPESAMTDPALSQSVSLLPEPPAPGRDPLLTDLEPDGTSLLLLGASPLPARSLLRLTVAPAYALLPEGVRRQRALDWWAGAQGLGFEQLELRDQRGLLQARSALVGEGLVLFEPGSG